MTRNISLMLLVLAFVFHVATVSADPPAGWAPMQELTEEPEDTTGWIDWGECDGEEEQPEARQDVNDAYDEADQAQTDLMTAMHAYQALVEEYRTKLLANSPTCISTTEALNRWSVVINEYNYQVAEVNSMVPHGILAHVSLALGDVHWCVNESLQAETDWAAAEGKWDLLKSFGGAVLTDVNHQIASVQIYIDGLVDECEN